MAIIKKNGIEVAFTSPIKKTYQIETSDKEIAVGIAIDTIKRKYPTANVKDIQYTTSIYTYDEIKW